MFDAFYQTITNFWYVAVFAIVAGYVVKLKIG